MPTRQARGSSTPNRRGYPRRDPNRDHAAVVGSASDRHSRSPGYEKFEHIPSISRSSGVGPDGDTYVRIVQFLESFLKDTDRLKDLRVQEQYRLFLQQKVIGYIKSCICAHCEDDQSSMPIGSCTLPRRILRRRKFKNLKWKLIS